MDLFGRKKKKELEELEEEERLQEEETQRKISFENKKLRKKLKDLAPENTRGRKEPVKPWGKKERIVVGSFFIITTFIATVLFLFSHGFKLPGLPRISLKSINLENPFGEEIIEIGQKGNGSSSDIKANNAISYFKENIKPLSGFYGFLVIRLNSGESYGVSTNSSFQGASLLKLPLMTLIYKLSDEGTINLDEKYILKESDKVPGSGVLFNETSGNSYSFRELVRLMGHDSDRTAYKIMKQVVGEDRLKEFVSEIGMEGTDIVSGKTTPTDMGIILQKLWDGKIISEESKEELLSFLTDTIYEDWIPAGISGDIEVAHKVGIDSGVVADAGIVISEHPYVLVIMSEGINRNDADIMFSEFSKEIYTIEEGSE